MPTFAEDRTHFNIAVFVMVQNSHGEYLLQQRQNTTYMNGHWDFSGSGHLERGETIRACAVRELQEETGLEVSPDELKLVQVLQHDVGKWPYVDFLFVTHVSAGDVATNELEKVADLKWFLPKDFPDQLTLALHSFVQAGFPDEGMGFAYVDETVHETLTGQTYAQSELTK